MRNILIQDDIKLVETRLKSFEANTGCELLLVVADASDPYPGASWRFGVVSSFFIIFLFSHYLDFHHSYLWPLSFFSLTLFMTWLGHFSWAKKLALSKWEVERECNEKALEYFHTMGTSQVSHKVTAMVMISILEKRIQVMVDQELKDKIDQKELQELVGLIQSHFKKGNVALGLVQSIQSLEEKILKSFNGKVSEVAPSELKDTIQFVGL